MNDARYRPEANPLRTCIAPQLEGLRFSRPPTRISLSGMRMPAGLVGDPQFLDHYVQVDLGGASFLRTRMRLDQITNGFFLRNSQGTVECHDDKHLTAHVVPRCAKTILAGDRPPLFVYRCTLMDRYVAADDWPVHEAYRYLGVTKVPVLLMGSVPTDHMEDAAIRFLNLRAVKGIDQEEMVKYEFLPAQSRDRVCGIQADNVPAVATVVDRSCDELMERLLVRMQDSAAGNALHHNHMLHASLAQLKQSVQGVVILHQHGLFDQAIAVLRMIYEQMATVYLYWIHPSFYAEKARVYSTMKEDAIERECADRLGRLRRAGAAEADVAAVRRSLEGLLDLLKRPSARGRLTPLGKYHGKLYEIMSRFTHQDISLTAMHTKDLPDVDRTTSMNREYFVLKSLIAFSGQILDCIGSDVGQSAVPAQPLGTGQQ